MTNRLLALLNRLKDHQRDLIIEAAKIDSLPPTNLVRRIAELENAIAAVEAVSAEKAKPDQPHRG